MLNDGQETGIRMGSELDEHLIRVGESWIINHKWVSEVVRKQPSRGGTA